MKFTLIITLSFLLFTSFLMAKSGHDPDQDSAALKKPISRVDEGVGVMIKGQLQNLTMNYGQITDTRLADPGNSPSDDFFNFRYPRKNYAGLVDDLSLVFAIAKNSKNGNNGNVIDGYTANNNEDWIAKNGSLGQTHYDGRGSHDILTWFDGTPYLAHSDLPETWPLNKNGEPFWPGYFRRAANGHEIEGEFASDRDVYAIFTDQNNQQGDILGLEVEQMAYCYGNPLAEDIQFYEFYIHNTSDDTLHNAWVGHYHDPDCSDYGQETLVLPDPLFNQSEIPDAIIQRDFDGDLGGATIPNPTGVSEDFSYGVVVLETPENLGITDFHYFLDMGPSDDHELWPIISSRPNDPDIQANAQFYFHGAQPRIDDVSLITEKTDLAYLATTGPFDLLPGATVKYTLAVICAVNDADFLRNARYAEKMFKNHFTGPKAPPPPTLYAVPGDGQITLHWDDLSEQVPDPISGEIDFEGYKIYRSEDDGVTWGREITDARGEVIGYVPLAQFDLAENGVQGIDSINTFIYLGDDSGLRHFFIDSTVHNGMRYAYTITAYDRGMAANPLSGDPALQSLESARGASVAEKNFVVVTPAASVAASQPATFILTHPRGKTKLQPQIQIIDPRLLDTSQGLFYDIRFEGEPVDRYALFKNGSSRIAVFNINEPDSRLVDGFTVGCFGDLTPGGIYQVTDGHGKNVRAANQRDTTHFNTTGEWLTIVTETPGQQANLAARSSDFEIRFTETSSWAYSLGKPATSKAFMPVPFEIWDVSINRNYQVNCQIKENQADGIFQYGEAIYVVNRPYVHPQPDELLEATFPDDFPYIVTFWGKTATTALPQPGESVRIASFSPPQKTDRFRLEIQLPQFKQHLIDSDLDAIRVVPNPYVVTAAWEFKANVRQVRFMYLPPECKITIYTLAGVKVREIFHINGTGDEAWDLTSDFGEDLAFGVYLYVVTSGEAKKVGKLAIIK